MNIAAAIQLAQELGPGKTVATVAVDTGLKYLIGDLFHGLSGGQVGQISLIDMSHRAFSGRGATGVRRSRGWRLSAEVRQSACVRPSHGECATFDFRVACPTRL
jgi:hypothetical protein